MDVYCNVSGFPHKNWNKSCEQVISDLAELQGKDKVIDLCARKISDTAKTDHYLSIGQSDRQHRTSQCTVFSWFSSVPPSVCRDRSSVKLWSLPSKSFLVVYQSYCCSTPCSPRYRQRREINGNRKFEGLRAGDGVMESFVTWQMYSSFCSPLFVSFFPPFDFFIVSHFISSYSSQSVFFPSSSYVLHFFLVSGFLLPLPVLSSLSFFLPFLPHSFPSILLPISFIILRVSFVPPPLFFIYISSLHFFTFPSLLSFLPSFFPPLSVCLFFI